MQVDYIHGNPQRGNFKIKKPTLAQVKKIWGSKVAAKLKKAQMSNPAKKTAKSVAKKTTKKVNKPSSSRITIEEARKLFSKSINKSQGGSAMAVKKAKRKVSKKPRSAAQKAATKKMIASNKKKRAGKKVVRKVHKKAAHKKVVRKVVAKKVAHKKVARKSKAKRGMRHARSMVKAGSSHIASGKFHRSFASTGGKSGKGYAGKGSSTKMPMPGRKLRTGEELDFEVERTTRKGKRRQTKVYKGAVIRTNPHKRHKKRKNPIILSNPHKRHKKRKNPLVFLKNPIGAMIGMESKVIGMLKPIDAITSKFLNVGVLEIAGLAVGASFDGTLLAMVKKIPMTATVLAKVPAEYQAPAVMGMSGLLLHAVNSLIGKKSGKKSVILDEIAKGMIAAALVKSFASMSSHSAENDVALAGYQYTPKSMAGYIHSNPNQASMPVGRSDFQGADFNGADFQGKDSVGGADFDGYVQSMGGIDDAHSFPDDFGTDSHSLRGNW